MTNREYRIIAEALEKLREDITKSFEFQMEVIKSLSTEPKLITIGEYRKKIEDSTICRYELCDGSGLIHNNEDTQKCLCKTEDQVGMDDDSDDVNPNNV